MLISSLEGAGGAAPPRVESHRGTRCRSHCSRLLGSPHAGEGGTPPCRPIGCSSEAPGSADRRPRGGVGAGHDAVRQSRWPAPDPMHPTQLLRRSRLQAESRRSAALRAAIPTQTCTCRCGRSGTISGAHAGGALNVSAEALPLRRPGVAERLRRSAREGWRGTAALPQGSSRCPDQADRVRRSTARPASLLRSRLPLQPGATHLNHQPRGERPNRMGASQSGHGSMRRAFSSRS